MEANLVKVHYCKAAAVPHTDTFQKENSFSYSLRQLLNSIRLALASIVSAFSSKMSAFKSFSTSHRVLIKLARNYILSSGLVAPRFSAAACKPLHRLIPLCLHLPCPCRPSSISPRNMLHTASPHGWLLVLLINLSSQGDLSHLSLVDLPALFPTTWVPFLPCTVTIIIFLCPSPFHIHTGI